MFHRFVELDGTRLVRSLDLDYDRVDAARGSLLASATTVGWAPALFHNLHNAHAVPARVTLQAGPAFSAAPRGCE